MNVVVMVLSVCPVAHILCCAVVLLLWLWLIVQCDDHAVRIAKMALAMMEAVQVIRATWLLSVHTFP